MLDKRVTRQVEATLDIDRFREPRTKKQAGEIEKPRFFTFR